MVALEFVIIEVETLNPHSLWIYHEWQQNQIKWTFYVTIFITMLRTSIIPPTIAARKFLVSSFGEENLETAECSEWLFCKFRTLGILSNEVWSAYKWYFWIYVDLWIMDIRTRMMSKIYWLNFGVHLSRTTIGWIVFHFSQAIQVKSIYPSIWPQKWQFDTQILNRINYWTNELMTTLLIFFTQIIFLIAKPSRRASVQKIVELRTRISIWIQFHPIWTRPWHEWWLRWWRVVSFVTIK